MKFTKEDLIRAGEELGFATDSFIQYINDTVEENDKEIINMDISVIDSIEVQINQIERELNELKNLVSKLKQQ